MSLPTPQVTGTLPAEGATSAPNVSTRERDVAASPSTAPLLSGNKVGTALLTDLLQRPPVQVATWALGQLDAMSKPNVEVNTLPIFQLVGVASSTPMDQKQALVRKAISGFAEVPAEKRTAAVRLVMQNPDLMQLQQAGNTASSAPPRSELMRNLLLVAKEGKFDTMRAEDLTSIAQEAQGVAAQVLKPDQILEVVKDLRPEEREQLTDKLVEAHVVPEQQRDLIEEAVRPGGYADKLTSALKVLDLACEFRWLFIFVFPVAEMIFAVSLGWLPCGTPLVMWLRVDTALTLAVACSVFYTSRLVDPIYQRLRDNPMRMVQRWQTVTDENPHWRGRFETFLPDVSMDTYQAGATGIVCCMFFELIGACWATFGVMHLMLATSVGCSGSVVFFCVMFIALRYIIVVALLVVVFYAHDEMERRSPKTTTVVSSSKTAKGGQQKFTPSGIADAAKPSTTQASCTASTAMTTIVAGSSERKPEKSVSMPQQVIKSLTSHIAPAARGRELHRKMASEHADLMERLGNLESGIRSKA